MSRALTIGLGAPVWEGDPKVIDWDFLVQHPALFAAATLGLSNAARMGIGQATAEMWVREYLVKWGVLNMFRKLLVVWPYDEGQIASEVQHLKDQRGPAGQDVQWPLNPLSLQRYNDAMRDTAAARAKLALEWLTADASVPGTEARALEAGVSPDVVVLEVAKQGQTTPPNKPVSGGKSGGVGALLLAAAAGWFFLGRR